MNKLRLLSVVLAAVAVAVLVSGTFGVSSIEANRGVDVRTVSDDRAYVGYEQAPDEEFFGLFDDLIVAKSGHEESLVEIQNRFGSAVDVTDIQADTRHVQIQDPELPADVTPGESGTVRGEIQCDDAFLLTKEHIGISVRVEGATTVAGLDGDTMQRRATVVCFNLPGHGFELHTGGQQPSAAANAAGGVSVPDRGEVVDATVWLADTRNQTVQRVSGEWDTGVEPRGFDPELGNGIQIVAIEFDGHGLAFARPGWQTLGGGSFDVSASLDDPALRPFDANR